MAGTASFAPPVGPVVLAATDGTPGAEVYFPWELDNTDYLRRALTHATCALQEVRTAPLSDTHHRRKSVAQPVGRWAGSRHGGPVLAWPQLAEARLFSLGST